MNCIHCNKWLDHCYFGNECMECVHKKTGINGFVPSSGLNFTYPLKHTFNLPSGTALYNSNDETITITKSDLEALSKNSNKEVEQLREENARLKRIIDKLLDK